MGLPRSVDGGLAARLISDDLLPWSVGASSGTSSPYTADLACRKTRAAVLNRVTEALRSKTALLRKKLTDSLREALAPNCQQRPISGAGIFPSVSVESKADQGRSTFVSSTKRIAMGSVVLRDGPIEWVPLDDHAEGVDGPGGLDPETALAVRLWRAEVDGNATVRQLATELVDHIGAPDSWLQSKAVIAVACVFAAVSDGKTPPLVKFKDQAMAVDQLFSWMSIVRVNAACITSMEESDSGQVRSFKRALGLFPVLAASVNHSCRPNALLRFGGRGGLEVEVVVSAPCGLGAGDEIVISYGPLATSMPTRQRQAVLRSQYGFECRCLACMRPNEDFSWRRGAEVLDSQAQVEASRGEWRASAMTASSAISVLRAGYLDSDVELARERCKLAGLFLQAGDDSRAFEEWSVAASVLCLLVARDDPDLIEASAMVNRLETVVRPRRAFAANGFSVASSHTRTAQSMRHMTMSLTSARVR